MNFDFEFVVKNLVFRLDKKGREEAREALLNLDHDALRITLSTLLQSADMSIRLNAAEAMFRIDSDMNQEAVMSLLDDPNEVVRGHVCGLLYDFGDARAVPRLLRVLTEDTDGQVRLMAVHALAKLCDGRCLPPLLRAAEIDNGQDYEGRTVKEAAIDAIHEIRHRIGTGKGSN